MTKTEKLEIQGMIDEAVEAGIIKALKAIYNDKDKLVELIEDIGLGMAIENGMKSETINKNEFMKMLENKIK